MATTTIARWGNSLGLRIPKDAAEQVQLHEGDEVEIVVANGQLSVIPSGASSLDQMIAMITPDNVHSEAFTQIAGAEAW